jgi:two-component system chemotaxis sensor kinase CheA
MVSELLAEFIFDAREHLATAGNQLLDLEKTPDSLRYLNALLGTLHTIKGNSGFVSLNNLYRLLHSAENLLQTVRDTAEHLCPPNIINQLFQVLDTVEAILSRLENEQDDTVEWLSALNEAIEEAEASVSNDGDSRSSASASRIEPVPAALSVSEPTKSSSAISSPKPAQSPALSISPDPEHPSELFRIISLSDGQLAASGEAFVEGLIDLQRKGHFKGLILNLAGITSFTAQEMRLVSLLGQQFKNRLALILDPQIQSDFWRVFRIWSLDRKLNFYAKESQAITALAVK